MSTGQEQSDVARTLGKGASAADGFSEQVPVGTWSGKNNKHWRRLGPVILSFELFRVQISGHCNRCDVAANRLDHV